MKFTRDYIEKLERFMFTYNITEIKGRCFDLISLDVAGTYKIKIGCLGYSVFVGTIDEILQQIENSQFKDMEI